MSRSGFWIEAHSALNTSLQIRGSGESRPLSCESAEKNARGKQQITAAAERLVFINEWEKSRTEIQYIHPTRPALR